MSIFKKLLNSIFSVHDDGKYYIYTFLGIKIKSAKFKKYNGEYDNLPLQNNKIMLRHHFGSYACNVKYITEELLKQNLHYDIVWVVNEHYEKFKNDFPENVRTVSIYSPEIHKEYATAKIWVDSERRSLFVSKGLNKRDGQIYIQTFHGSLGIKKTAPDRDDIPPEAMKNSQIDSSQIDYLISNGKYTTDFFKRIFWNNGKILEVGHPRNDIFFKDNILIKDKVYKYFNIPQNKKIVLYAPTLREDKDMTCYTLDANILSDALNKRFGGEWVVMLRLHPLLLSLKEQFSAADNTIDATDYGDIQELLVTSEAVITDYSSCIYDFMLTYKPGFIYATDIEKYDNGRGFYYSLTDTPFPIGRNNEELVEKILSFDEEKYKKEVKEFLDEKGCIDDGHASERVVDLIKNIIEGSKEKETEKQEALV